MRISSYESRMPGYSSWHGALWLAERIYRILQRRETGVCRGLKKKKLRKHDRITQQISHVFQKIKTVYAVHRVLEPNSSYIHTYTNTYTDIYIYIYCICVCVCVCVCVCDPLCENPAKVIFFVICFFLQKLLLHMVKTILWKCNLYIFNIDWAVAAADLLKRGSSFSA